MNVFAIEYLSQSSLVVRKATIQRITLSLFPVDSSDGAPRGLWLTRRRITQVKLYTEELVMKNVKGGMFKEKLGSGPRYYYIKLLVPLPTYYSRLFCLTGLLPSEKFIISPLGMKVSGRFFNTTQGRQLQAQTLLGRIIPEEDLLPYCGYCKSSLCFL